MGGRRRVFRFRDIKGNVSEILRGMLSDKAEDDQKRKKLVRRYRNTFSVPGRPGQFLTCTYCTVL